MGPKPSTVGCSERRDPRRLVGARVRKLWHLGVAGGSRWFTGKITAHYDDDTWGDVYNVHYQEVGGTPLPDSPPGDTHDGLNL